MAAPTPLKRVFFETQRTQRSLASELGIDPGHLSKIVNGLLPPAPTREAIAKALCRSVDELWPASIPADREAA